VCVEAFCYATTGAGMPLWITEELLVTSRSGILFCEVPRRGVRLIHHPAQWGSAPPCQVAGP